MITPSDHDRPSKNADHCWSTACTDFWNPNTFHSWIQSLDATFDREVEFFYTAPDPGRALFADDIAHAALGHPSLHLHLIASQRQGHLTPEQVAATVAAPHEDVWVYMCGPLEMMRTFDKQLHKRGFPRRHIVWERFEIR